MKDMILRHPNGHEVPVPGWLVKEKVAQGFEPIRPVDAGPELEVTEMKELSKELLPAYLEARTRDELREIAQAGKIDIPGNASKAAFIEAILAKSAEEADDEQ